MNIFQRIRALILLHNAIDTADRQWQLQPNHYYVVGSFNNGRRRLIIVDRNNFRRLKAKHYINPNVTLHNLRGECFYFTPNRAGLDRMHTDLLRVKKRQYLAWVEACIRARRQPRNA